VILRSPDWEIVLPPIHIPAVRDDHAR
jgi:hypothetical protein